jgi:hypothetical protein
MHKVDKKNLGLPPKFTTNQSNHKDFNHRLRTITNTVGSQALRAQTRAQLVRMQTRPRPSRTFEKIQEACFRAESSDLLVLPALSVSLQRRHISPRVL